MRRLFSAIALVSCLAFSAPALAIENGDFELSKLGYPDGATADAANARFRMFATQLATAISGFNFAPPTTTGHAGFNIALEYGVSMVDKDFWPTHNNDSGFLMMPTLHVRKGLGFSFELGGRVSYLIDSSMVAGTLDLKWALNEGIAYAPDFAVRGMVTKLFGATDLSLVAAGVDVGIGKKFGLGGDLTITPYAGWNILFTHASTRMIEGKPDRTQEDALAHPFDTLRAFDTVEMADNFSHRFYGGLRFRIIRQLEIALEFSYAMISISHGVEDVAEKTHLMNFGGKIGMDF